MLFAAYNDTGFKVMLLLHILSVIVAFGPLFFMPMLARSARATAAPPRCCTSSASRPRPWCWPASSAWPWWA